MQVRQNLSFVVDFRKFVDNVQSLCEDLALLKFDRMASLLGKTYFSTQEYHDKVEEIQRLYRNKLPDATSTSRANVREESETIFESDW